MSIEIRPATPSDAPQILAFITELADYERARHEVIASVTDIERSGIEEWRRKHHDRSNAASAPSKRDRVHHREDDAEECHAFDSNSRPNSLGPS